ncbi:Protein of unknown function [Propionibacterium freudenreichii]|nr:Protein of unknown function [Propionibacterium freudenreichii]CEH10997.1 Protein of unknown function [Propionibacterium freudenreichii]CEI22275.1 Protein of unknown function [Propionibacterium freudenreichii]CEI49668.1 Protein of unknown function [Propionibacterium freudenreichii]
MALPLSLARIDVAAASA